LFCSRFCSLATALMKQGWLKSVILVSVPLFSHSTPPSSWATSAVRNKAETQPFSAVEKAIFWSPSAETNSSMLIALMSASVLHISEL